MQTRLKSILLLVALATTASLLVSQAPEAAKPAVAAAPSASRVPTIRRLLEDHVRQVLRRYVAESEMHVKVDVTASGGPSGKIPYLPPTDTAAVMANLSPDRLVAATQKVEIQIALAKRYQAKTRTKLDEMLKSSLGLRGEDVITFDVLDLELPTPRSDIEVSLLRIEGDLRSERNRAEQMRKERDDLKLEVVAAKTEAERLALEAKAKPDAAAAEKAADPAAAKPDGTPAEEKAPVESQAVNRLRDFGVPLVFAGVLVMLALLWARSLGGIAGGMRDAAGSMSQAIEAIASNLASAVAPGASAETASAEKAVAQAGDGGPARLPIDAVQAAVKELHEDLSTRLNDQTEPHIVRYLSQQLAVSESVAKAVAGMELFGRDHANHLFQLLGSPAQAAVLDFIRHGHYGKPKLELMLEAGEEIKTQLLGEAVMKTVSAASQEIASRIFTFANEDLAKTALGLSEKIAARMLTYIDPPRIAALLTEVHRTSPKEIVRLSEAILKIPEAGEDKGLDVELLAALDAAEKAKVADVHRPYLKFYGDIIAATDESVTEAILGRFLANPQVAGYIRRNTVTFSMFFTVARDIQEELLAALTVKDVAALVSGLTAPAEKAKVEELLPERRREAMREELQQLTTRGSRQVQNLYRGARGTIVKRMLNMQRQGTLEFAEQQQQPRLAAAPDQAA